MWFFSIIGLIEFYDFEIIKIATKACELLLETLPQIWIQGLNNAALGVPYSLIAIITICIFNFFNF